MGCDYYVQSELVIEYLDKIGRNSVIRTNIGRSNQYIYNYDDSDSDDDEETKYKKYLAEIERKIKENTYDKVLFDNNEWIKESYKKRYEEKLKRDFKEISIIKKIYKKVTAWKRN
jgi:hypothetical protein